MTTLVRACGILSVAALVMVAAPQPEATCGASTSRNFGNYPSSKGCGGGRCYLLGASTKDVRQLESAWWMLGMGNPTAGAGIDNGRHLDDGSAGTGGWIYPDGNHLVVGGGGANTDAGPTDGCPDADNDFSTPDFLMLAVSDPAGHWALSSATQNGDQTFDFDRAGQHIRMVPIPAPSVSASSPIDAKHTRVTLAPPPLAALQAGYLDNTGGAVKASQVITGYRVWAHVVRPGAFPSADRRTATGWKLLTPDKRPLGTATTVTLECPADCDAHLGLSLVFDGQTPFETGSVSAKTALVQVRHPRKP